MASVASFRNALPCVGSRRSHIRSRGTAACQARWCKMWRSGRMRQVKGPSPDPDIAVLSSFSPQSRITPQELAEPSSLGYKIVPERLTWLTGDWLVCALRSDLSLPSQSWHSVELDKLSHNIVIRPEVSLFIDSRSVSRDTFRSEPFVLDLHWNFASRYIVSRSRCLPAHSSNSY